MGWFWLQHTASCVEERMAGFLEQPCSGVAGGGWASLGIGDLGWCFQFSKPFWEESG